jgi:outer membrane autotransporter protein
LDGEDSIIGTYPLRVPATPRALSLALLNGRDQSTSGDLPPAVDGDGDTSYVNGGVSTENPLFDCGLVALSFVPTPDPIQGGAGVLFTGTTGQTLAVNNSGMIAGGNGSIGGYGIQITGGNANITNAVTGVISSPSLAAIYSSSLDGVAISNYGIISSPTKAISFTGGANSVTLYSNSVTVGALEFNATSNEELLTFSGLLNTNFDNTITGLNTIKAIAGAQISLTASTYTFVNGTVDVDGASALTLAGNVVDADGPLSSITKTGAGNLTLTGANFYSGNTTVTGGTLGIAGAGTLGTSTISITGGTLDLGSKSLTNQFGSLTGGTLANGTLSNTGSSYDLRNGTVSAQLAGTNGVAKTTSGVVTLSAYNTYSGGTSVQDGKLWVQAPRALGTGNVTIQGVGAKLLVSSSQEMEGNLRIDGNLDWSEGKIGFYDTGRSPSSGDLTINVGGSFTVSTSGSATFDFSEVEALDSGNYTLVLTDGTLTADNSKFTAVHGNYTTLYGYFTTTANTVIYSVTGANSGGPNIQNNGGPNTPVISNYAVSIPTITVGLNNTVSALTFTNGASLAIQSGGQLTISNGTIIVQSESSTVNGGTIITAGNFDKTGLGRLNLENNAVVNGIANVDEGILSVNGQMQTTGGVRVSASGILGGNGFITGDVNVNGGNLSPGNSPGTLTIVGNLNFDNASATTIEIASLNDFDRIVVSGEVTLDGTLNAVAYGGRKILPGARYDILQAGNIVGEYDVLLAPDDLRIRFLNANTVGTLLFAPKSFVPYALNKNQRNVAKALDSFVLVDVGDAVIAGIALDSLTVPQFPTAFNLIMPSFYESLANMSIEQEFNRIQILNQRMGSVRLASNSSEAGVGNAKSVVNNSKGSRAKSNNNADSTIEHVSPTSWNTWTLGTGMFSRTTDLRSLQDYNTDAGGFLVGSDCRLNDNFVAGLYAGYDYSEANYNGGGGTKKNSFSFGGYASYDQDGYYADAVVGGGYTEFKTKRLIQFSTIDRTSSADPSSGQFTAGLNFGKDFEVNDFTIGPIAGMQYTYAGIESFAESGADSLDLSLGQQSAKSLRGTLGGRVAYNWNINHNITLIPEARIFWQHEFLNNTRIINASLEGDRGTSFNYETADPYRNSAFAGVGVAVQVGQNLSGSVFYNINFGSQTYQNNMVSAALSLSF